MEKKRKKRFLHLWFDVLSARTSKSSNNNSSASNVNSSNRHAFVVPASQRWPSQTAR